MIFIRIPSYPQLMYINARMILRQIFSKFLTCDDCNKIEWSVLSNICIDQFDRVQRKFYECGFSEKYGDREAGFRHVREWTKTRRRRPRKHSRGSGVLLASHVEGASGLAEGGAPA